MRLETISVSAVFEGTAAKRAGADRKSPLCSVSSADNELASLRMVLRLSSRNFFARRNISPAPL